MLEMHEAQQVAREVMTLALKDAEGGDMQALAWLASKQAAPYYDILALEQSAVLARSGWMRWAGQTLQACVGNESYMPHHEAVAHAYAYMQGLQKAH